MCEYCGCQEVTAIGDLTREHEVVVNLIGEVRSAYGRGDVVAMVDLARRISAVLGPHTEVEEHGLFPALAGDFAPQIAALESEHRHIEAVLGSATTLDPAWPRRLIDALAVLREHILKEQDGVFPAALTSLRTEDWEAVDAVRVRAVDAVRVRAGSTVVGLLWT
jgi:hemerythrin-like domain-containing protein